MTPIVVLPVLDIQIPFFEKSNVQHTVIAHDYQGDESLETVELKCSSDNLLRMQNSDYHLVMDKANEKQIENI